MGILDSLVKTVLKSTGVTKCSLLEATKEAPNLMGCYKIYLNGQLKYIGKAEDGIRKRFVQYYNGTTAHYTSARNIYSYRDELEVSWIVLASREQRRTVEAEWIERYNPEWNKQSGWRKR